MAFENRRRGPRHDRRGPRRDRRDRRGPRRDRRGPRRDRRDRRDRRRSQSGGESSRRAAGSMRWSPGPSTVATAIIASGYRSMRIAIDIDSTLHHYWPLLSAAAKRRFGVELPYDRQFT